MNTVINVNPQGDYTKFTYHLHSPELELMGTITYQSESYLKSRILRLL